MNKVLINDRDIEDWGFLYGDYPQYLFQPPEPDELDVTDWYEGGHTVDLTDGITFPKERTIKIGLFLDDAQTNYYDIIGYLKSKSRHTITFNEFSESITARYDGCDVEQLPEWHQKITFTFIEEDFNSEWTDSHIKKRIITTDCYIDNKNINEYGYSLLEGSLDELLNETAIERLRDATEEVNCKCQSGTLKIGSSMATSDYKTNYHSLLALLTKPGSRQMTIRYAQTDIVLSVYVTNIECEEFYWNESNVFCNYNVAINILSIQPMRMTLAARSLSHGEITMLNNDFYFDLYPVFSLYLVPNDLTDKRTELADVILENESKIQTVPLVIDDYNDCNVKVFPMTERNINLLSIYRIFYFSSEFLSTINNG